VREALVAPLSAGRRAAIHWRLADALEPRLAEVAHHRLSGAAAGDAIVAAECALAAAGEAMQALAYEDAADLARRALDVVGPGASADLRGRLLLRLGDAELRAGAPEVASKALREAAALGDPALRARALLSLAGLGVTIGAPDGERLRALRDAADALGGDEPALQARLLAALATESYYGTERDETDSLTREALVHAEASGDAATLAQVLSARRVALWAPEQTEERIRVGREIVSRAREAGDLDLELQGRGWQVVDLLEIGDLAGADREIERYAALAERARLPAYRWYVPLWRAGRAIFEGRFAEADALTEEARALGAAAGDANAELFAFIQGVQSLIDQRRFADVDVEAVEKRTRASPVPAAWEVWLVIIYAETGDRARAEQLHAPLAADGHAALPMDVNWHAVCDAAEGCALLGDADAAARLYERLAPHARLWPVVGRGVACYGPTEYFLGRLAATCGQPVDAERHFGAVVEELGDRPRGVLAAERRRHTQNW
jgi:hypothetical protein